MCCFHSGNINHLKLMSIAASQHNGKRIDMPHIPKHGQSSLNKSKTNGLLRLVFVMLYCTNMNDIGSVVRLNVAFEWNLLGIWTCIVCLMVVFLSVCVLFFFSGNKQNKKERNLLLFEWRSPVWIRQILLFPTANFRQATLMFDLGGFSSSFLCLARMWSI